MADQINIDSTNPANKSGRTVWLSYVGYPVTTAAYLERALKKLCRTITVGPPLPPELIERWQLQNMKLPPIRHDIVTGFTPDMGTVRSENPDMPPPDLYLWVESVPGHTPSNIAALGCPSACYLIDSHLNLEHHLESAPNFDYVFIAQRAYLDQFRSVNPRSYWLPLACDPEIHRRWPLEQQWDIGFVGSVFPGSERESLLARLTEAVPVHHERCFWDDMAQVFSASRIVFNNAVNHDLNMRFFEVLSTGTLLLSDLACDSGQSELFGDGEEYACYHRGNLPDVAKFYLDNEQLRERIAHRGQLMVHNAHTYLHRMEDLLAVVLDDKQNTFSAEELRRRSLAGIPDPTQELKGFIGCTPPPRSFVIPVLDYSPASEYNILTLLEDLKDIDGEVIVVFNGSAVGEELKSHPRITRHAIMKQNVGVARGWNIGLHMAEAETVFIVNADAHITMEAVRAVEQGLQLLPDAVCTGPQGSFVNFSLCSDFYYFDKGSFEEPVSVDAVSGFFFAVNRCLMARHGLHFEDAFTPCYFEEWDLGLQIRRAGLKCYAVPTTAYTHHWSGTIRALQQIPYMGKHGSAPEILLRNRQIFLAKWRSIARQEQRPHLLESGWKDFLRNRLAAALAGGASAMAAEAAKLLQQDYPDDESTSSLVRLAGIQALKEGCIP